MDKIGHKWAGQLNKIPEEDEQLAELLFDAPVPEVPEEECNVDSDDETLIPEFFAFPPKKSSHDMQAQDSQKMFEL